MRTRLGRGAFIRLLGRLRRDRRTQPRVFVERVQSEPILVSACHVLHLREATRLKELGERKWKGYFGEDNRVAQVHR